MEGREVHLAGEDKAGGIMDEELLVKTENAVEEDLAGDSVRIENITEEVLAGKEIDSAWDYFC